MTLEDGLDICDYCETREAHTKLGDAYGVYDYCDECAAIIERQAVENTALLLAQGHFKD